LSSEKVTQDILMLGAMAASGASDYDIMVEVSVS
jgi:hypothetical protein